MHGSTHSHRHFVSALAGLALPALIAGLVAAPVTAAPLKKLSVTVDSFKSGSRIPSKYAYCVAAKTGHTAHGGDVNPRVRWSKGPAGTKSYAIVTVDPDVPTVFDDADKEGKTIPAGMKRMNFYHWLLVDIPASKSEIAMGADSSGFTGKGKPTGPTPNGVRGANDYSSAKGVFGGYDGPCPPWNDARLHHYHYIVYALDVPTLGLSGDFRGPAAEAAIAKHALAKGKAVGTYTQNPALAKAKG
jgi:Raf kinase inhibitor-like YbhB/YbcL family protein